MPSPSYDSSPSIIPVTSEPAVPSAEYNAFGEEIHRGGLHRMDNPWQPRAGVGLHEQGVYGFRSQTEERLTQRLTDILRSVEDYRSMLSSGHFGFRGARASEDMMRRRMQGFIQELDAMFELCQFPHLSVLATSIRTIIRDIMPAGFPSVGYRP